MKKTKQKLKIDGIKIRACPQDLVSLLLFFLIDLLHICYYIHIFLDRISFIIWKINIVHYFFLLGSNKIVHYNIRCNTTKIVHYIYLNYSLFLLGLGLHQWRRLRLGPTEAWSGPNMYLFSPLFFLLFFVLLRRMVYGIVVKIISDWPVRPKISR